MDGISFLDDELVAFKNRILELCEELKNRNLHKRIQWSAHTSSISADEEVFRAMKDAGCVLLRIGLESGSGKILKFLKSKAFSIERNYEAVKLARKAGLNVFGSFIIGSPGENEKDIVNTIHFIKNSGLTDCAVFIAVPYPGTRLYTICKEKGYLKPNLSFNAYCIEGFGASSIIRNEFFTAEQLSAIKRLINIHVTEPLNNGTEIHDLDFRYELEKIKRGDFRMADYSIPQKLMRQDKRFVKNVLIGMKEPKRIFHYVLRHMRYR